MNPKIEIQNVYPLTPLQEGMLFHTLWDQESGAYVEQMQVELTGQIEIGDFQEAYAQLVARHDVLRTVFKYTNVEKPLQAVLKEAAVRLQTEDVRHLEDAQREAYVQAFREKDAQRGFTPTKEIPIRLFLLRTGEERYTLLLSFHHIILDGWSLSVVLQELFTLYNSLRLKQPAVLGPTFAYGEYVRWLARQDQLAAAAYWKEALAGYEISASLPMKGASSGKRKTADVLRFSLDELLTLELQTLAQAHNVTLATVFQTLWGLLLQRYNGSDDVVFGTVVSGRSSSLPGIERAVGMFIQTVPVRLQSAGRTFAELLKSMHGAVLEAGEHGHYPLYQIQAGTKRQQELFDHVVAFENYPLDKEALTQGQTGCTVTDYAWHEQTHYDFHLIVLPGKELVIQCYYDPEVMDAAVIGRVETHLKQLAREAIAGANRPAAELGLLTEEETGQLLNQWNNRQADYPREETLSGLFEACVAAGPERIAVVGEDSRLTYGELNYRANQLAMKLREEGVGEDVRVALLMERSPEMLVGILAVLKAGGAYVPIDPDYPLERIRYIVGDSSAVVLLSDRVLSAEEQEGLLSVEQSPVRLLTTADSDLAARAGENLPAVHSPSSLAYVLYTSGTTGVPKGVMIEHRNVVQLLLNDQLPFAFGAEDVWSVFHAYGFDFSVWEMYGALLYGGRCVIVPRRVAQSPAAFLELLIAEGVTVLNQTPTAFYGLIREACEGLKGSQQPKLAVRYVIFGGEALQPQMLKPWKAAYPEITLVNMYGITETTVHVTYKEITEAELAAKASVIGLPLPTVTGYVMDSAQRLVPIGVAGELYVGGDGVARGYLNRDELTLERFVANPYLPQERLYRSGDLMRRRADGELEYLGRIDHQVKIRGHRIEIGEVEHRLLSHPLVQEGTVLAQELQGQTELCAYVVLKEDVTIGELRTHMQGGLPAYMVPSHFIRLEQIPLTVNGKIDRKALPAPDESSLHTGVAYAAPATPLQAELCSIWQDVLGVKQVGIHDNFFDLGGHSLKATQLISKIHKQLEVSVPLKQLFVFPTVEATAEYVRSAEAKAFVPIEPVSGQSNYPVSAAQRRMLIIDQLEGAGTGYNIPVTFIIEGKLELDRMAAAFRKLIERHESLRTTFHMRDGEVVQEVHAHYEFNLQITPYSATPLEERIDALIRSFDLSRLPLLRVELLELEAERHLFFLDIHHIAADGTSMGILVKEFMQLYKGNELPDLRIQYKDFAVWHNKRTSDYTMRRDELYWQEVLSDGLSVLQLPTDFVRPPVQSFEGNQLRFNLPQLVNNQLHQLAAETGTTFYMVLLSVYAVLLGTYASQDEVVVGTGIADRPHTDLEHTIGMFVNMLVMKSHPKRKLTFRQFLMEMKHTSLDAFEHQDYPFDTLVERSGMERDPSRNPLFDVAFVLQNMDIPEINIEGLQFIPYDYSCRTSKFDLTLYAWEHTDGARMLMEYSTNLFKRETIERLNGYYIQIAQEVGANPDQTLGAIQLLTDEEKRLFTALEDVDTAYPDGKSLPELFEDQVNRTPDRIAVEFEDICLTYRELNDRANNIAAYLVNEHDIQPDELVGILADNPVDRVAGIWGVLKAGGAYLPIDPDFPHERMKWMVDDAGVQVILSSKAYIKTLNSLQWDCPDLRCFVCIDSDNVYEETEEKPNELMNVRLWEYVGEQSEDDIMGGGWVNSYTGDHLSREEMDEYGDNVLAKLRPLLQQDSRVLEIGCASGISMFRIAPHVGLYYGTDMSKVIIEKDRQWIAEHNMSTIKLACLPAHQVDLVEEKSFDIVIINSVIQAFHGHNYLRQVVAKAIDLMSDKGVLFIGDVMDQDMKDELMQSLRTYKLQHPQAKTKTDFSEELFISRTFFKDLAIEMDGIVEIRFSPKIHTIENELTRFRYDVQLEIDKTKEVLAPANKVKLQHDRSMLNRYTEMSVKRDVSPDHLAYVMYTSGTTGKPKGVMIEQRSVIRLVHNTKYVPFAEADRVAQTGAISFDASVFEMFGAFLHGGALYPVRKDILLDAEQLELFLRKYHITTMWLTSPLFNQLSQERAAMFSSLRHLIVGGDALSPKHIHSVREASPGLAVWNGYGPTENTTFSTCYLIEGGEDPIPIGRPISHSTAYIVSGEGQLQPVGVAGELWVGGDGVARGYLNAPELTAEKFISDPFQPGKRIYRTGDSARWLANGQIAYLGRIDRQVKVRGHRIEPGEVETVLLQIQGIREAVVTIYRNRQDENEICAYFTSEDVLEGAELRASLAGLLPACMIPSHFIRLETMPLTGNGKVNQRALPKPGVSNKEKDYTAPQSPYELELVELWQDILGVDVVGVRDNFFQLGGHSLKATALISKIDQRLHVKVPLRVFFEKPYVENIAHYIAASKESMVDERYEPIPILEEKEVYELSFAQKRMFILSEYQGVDTTYHMPGAWILAGEIDADRMERAIAALIRRHESLRTSFKWQDGIPVQIIHDEASYQMERFVITTEQMQETIQAFIRPFSLSQAPLLRVGLVQYAEQRYMLMFDMHHIISDGVSMSVIIRDIADLYQNEQLPALRVQYKEYAEWHRKQMDNGAFETQKQYWLQRLSGELPILQLPADYARPAVQSFEGNRVLFSLHADLTAKVKQLALQEGTTSYTVLLAVYYILLAKYSGQDDFIVGTPIAGRRHADTQHMVGMFVNMVAMRNSPSSGKQFKQFLKEVADHAVQAFDHQDLPFEELVELLGTERDLSRNPVFDTVFSLQNMFDIEINLGGIQGTPYPFEFKMAKFDLTLEAVEVKNGFEFSLEYRIALFKQETVDRMADHYLRVIQAILEQPDLPIGEISLLNEEEKSLFLQSVESDGSIGSVSHYGQQTITEWFEDQVTRTPDHPAIMDEGHVISYHALNERSNRLARELRIRGVGAESHVAVLADRSAEMIVAILAVLKAGGAYVPIDPEFPEERQRFMLEDSEIRIILKSLAAEAPSLFEGTVLVIEDAAWEQHESTNMQVLAKADYLAYIMYTSGTTGNPKGVMVEHRNVIRLVDNMAYVPFMEIGRMAQTGAVSFDASIFEIFGTLLHGGTIYPVGKDVLLNVKSLELFLTENEITTMWLTTSLFHLFAQENPAMFAGLRHLVVGGEQLLPQPVHNVMQVCTKLVLWNGYGPTENTTFSTSYRVQGGEELVPIGRPISHSTAYIMNPEGHLQPVGVPGELWVGGAGVARGYLHAPELTAEKFVSDPFRRGERMYRTGDRACWRADGTIVYLGRMDRQLKIRGYRIEPSEIESVLLQVAGVKEAAVTTMENTELELELCAYVTADEELDLEQLRAQLALLLPGPMLPTHLMQLPVMPLTSNGKTDRKSLPKPDSSRSSQKLYVAPRDGVENRLAQLWQHILQVEAVGIHDHFFELGGHSLKATALISQVYREFHVQIPLRAVFQFPTLEQFAAHLRHTSSFQNKSVTIEPICEREYYPASSAQRRMYLIQHGQGADISYNMPAVLRISGRLDTTLAAEVFQKIIQRHEVLRTTFEMRSGELVQFIQPEARLNVPVFHSKEEELEALIHGFIQPFDLSQAPLLRAGVVCIGPDDHLLLFDMHHIVSDGTSMNVLIREFTQLYEGKELAPLRLQYKDYAVWQQSWLQSESFQKQESYWLETLSELPAQQLPTDYVRGEHRSFEGEELTMTIHQELVEALREMTEETGTTLYMALLAVYSILLSHICMQEDIVMGTPIAGRPDAKLDNLLGMFVNTFVIRTFPHKEKTFSAFLQEVKQTALDAYENQDYPFEIIAQKLVSSPDPSRNPIFDTMFALQNMGSQGFDFADLHIASYPLKKTVAKFDLLLEATEEKDEIQLRMEYSSHLFKKATIERLGHDYLSLLAYIVDHQDTLIGNIPIALKSGKYVQAIREEIAFDF